MPSATVGAEKTGYHGCDQTVADKVLTQGEHLYLSANDYDWLGGGTYFWEDSPDRAWIWAQRHPHPAVIGAHITLGHCFDLLQPENVALLRRHYRVFRNDMRLAGTAWPVNTPLFRRLDCAVIEHMHAYRDKQGFPPFDSLRGAFEEGEPVFPGSFLRTLTHIQLCVRNRACILSYFPAAPP
ncbi:MAG: hypothetical protein LBH86_07130 [Oscillospiraceae bacterium]|nr:hypothetical protein [Oscillospiraceae bacterium]